MHTTIINQPALRLVTARAVNFPEGTKEAFRSLERQLKSLKGRKMYGLVFEREGGMEYHAGLLPDNEIEERRLVALGFPIIEVAGGPCARAKLMDWSRHLDEIGPMIGAMIERHGIDPTRPTLEYDRSFAELHLLVPVLEPAKARRL